jgi:hypothetical protein
VNKKHQAKGQRQAELEEDCTGSQGPQRTVVLEKKEKKDKK